MHPINKQKAPEQGRFSKCHLGAHLQNLLKLFNALLDGYVTDKLVIPTARATTEKIIY
jgi:hypothetical protein